MCAGREQRFGEPKEESPLLRCGQSSAAGAIQARVQVRSERDSNNSIHVRMMNHPQSLDKPLLLVLHEGSILVRCGRSRFMRMNEDPEEGGEKAPAPPFYTHVLR